MKIGLYGSYHGLTAWIFQPIVWSTTPLHQDPDFEFISRAFWGDFCYKITSGCVGYDIVTLWSTGNQLLLIICILNE
jgi:hypothetical protein